MKKRDAIGTGLFAGAACAACCAPPIIAAIGLAAGLAATVAVVFGIAGAIAVAIIAATAIAARQRRTKTCETTLADLVSMPAPSRRDTSIQTAANRPDVVTTGHERVRTDE